VRHLHDAVGAQEGRGRQAGGGAIRTEGAGRLDKGRGQGLRSNTSRRSAHVQRQTLILVKLTLAQRAPSLCHASELALLWLCELTRFSAALMICQNAVACVAISAACRRGRGPYEQPLSGVACRRRQ